MTRSSSWSRIKAEFVTETNVEVDDGNANFLAALAEISQPSAGTTAAALSPGGMPKVGSLGPVDVLDDDSGLTTRQRYRAALFGG